MTTRRLFLSMVSDEFRAYRQLLAQDLARSSVEVCTQEKFGNLGETTLHKLDAYLKGCDAVVHVVGDGLGHVPPPAAVDALLAQHPTLLPMLAGYTGLTRDQLGLCSYTQWEAYLAIHHKVRLHIYQPDARAPREVGFVADPGGQTLQAAHFERIRKLGRDRDVFLNAERLSSYVLADLNDLLPPLDSRVVVAPTRLSHSATRLIGREAELALLDAAWSDAHTNLVVIRGKGGEGKTSLVAAWMAELAHKDWRGAERVLDWSFYSQGTRDQGSATADFCFNRLLTELGDPDPIHGSPEDRAQRLARLLNQQRTLLVLDGLEPLQYPPGAMQGRLKDNGMATLLRALVAQNRGLVVVTTRERLPEIEAHYGRSAVDHDLQFLSPLAGAQVLHHAGARRAGPAPIAPDDPELQAASREVRGHALTLFLIGNYLRLIDDSGRGGDIRQRQVIRLHEADHEVQNDPSRPYGHAFKAMEAYARWFANGDESARLQLSVLQMLGLFDRPASAACLEALREPPIPGLSDLWHGKPERQWTITLNRLREIKLVEPGAEGFVDTHPLIREYFARQLREGDPQGYQAAHARLFEYLCQTTEHRPDTLDGLQPLYQAVVHGCLAGRHQQACQVYRDRILRGTGIGGNFSTFKLGAIGADLGAVAAFFETTWSRPSPTLSQPDQAWLLNEAAFSLRSLGRLTEALEPMRVGLDRRIDLEDWKNAAIGASNLSELEVTLGALEPAVEGARRAIAYADRIAPPDLYQRMVHRTAAADALHQWGGTQAQGRMPQGDGTAALTEARQLFEQAEALQRQHQPDYELLYSLAGFRYCDLILALAERAAWRSLLTLRALDSATAASAVPASLKLPTSPEPRAQQQSSVDAPRVSPATRNESRPEATEALAEAERRAKRMFEWRVPGDPLLDIAQDHLTLARVALYRTMLDPTARTAYTAQPARTALDALRKANTLDHLPKALLTAAIAHYLTGDSATARALLDEAQQIAERGPMPLYLADVRLHRARLVGVLGTDERRKHWPGVDPRTELAQARALIDQHHYGRRFEELADAEAVLT
jgi:tetratricopeptide (TPR) repeat protein